MKLEFAAGGIIFKKDGAKFKFALILDSYGKWTFPKGHLNQGEIPEIGARREVGEEIGLKNLQVIKRLAKIDYWFKLQGNLHHKYVYYFLMQAPLKTKLIPETSEIKDAQWFDPQKTLEILDYKKDSVSLLKHAFEALKIVL